MSVLEEAGKHTHSCWENHELYSHCDLCLISRLLGFSDGSGKESACQCRRCGLNPWVGKIPWRKKLEPIPVLLPGESHGQRSLAGYSPSGRKSRTRLSDFATSNPLCLPGGSEVKASARNARDLGSIPGLGRSPGENANPLQYSCLENPMV